MKCKSCGKDIGDSNSSFCIYCGAMCRNPETEEILTENYVEENNPQTEMPVSDSEIMSDETEISEETDITEFKKEIPEQKSEKISLKKNIPEEIYESEPPKDNKITKIKVGGTRITAAFFLSVISSMIFIVVCIALSLKLGVTADGLQNSVRRMDTWTVINADIGGMSLSDRIYYACNFGDASQGYANKTEFAVYLSETDFMQFISSKTGKYADYILNGNGEAPTVTENELADFFTDYSNIGKDVFGYRMQTSDYNAIRKSLSANNISDTMSVDRIGWKLNFRLENIHFLLSYVTIGIFVALFLVILIWTAIIVDKRVRYLLAMYGNILFWSGAVLIIAGIGISCVSAIAYVLTGNFILYVSVSCLLPTAGYIVFIGGVSVVIGYILRKIRRYIIHKSKKSE
ncbi:MAG: hypothetical protein K2I00_08125 [Ruminococcus sp.]|nr:hypothetical protein [Ruminococcus sp.]